MMAEKDKIRQTDSEERRRWAIRNVLLPDWYEGILLLLELFLL